MLESGILTVGSHRVEREGGRVGEGYEVGWREKGRAVERVGERVDRV